MSDSIDYESILAHLRMKSEAGDTYTSMVAYLQRKGVPEDKVKEIMSTLQEEERARKAALAPILRKKKRRQQIVGSIILLCFGLIGFIGLYAYNLMTIRTGGFVIIIFEVLQWISLLVVLAGVIRLILMATRKPEYFDHI